MKAWVHTTKSMMTTKTYLKKFSRNRQRTIRTGKMIPPLTKLIKLGTQTKPKKKASRKRQESQLQEKISLARLTQSLAIRVPIKTPPTWSFTTRSKTMKLKTKSGSKSLTGTVEQNSWRSIRSWTSTEDSDSPSSIKTWLRKKSKISSKRQRSTCLKRARENSSDWFLRKWSLKTLQTNHD